MGLRSVEKILLKVLPIFYRFIILLEFFSQAEVLCGEDKELLSLCMESCI